MLLKIDGASVSIRWMLNKQCFAFIAGIWVQNQHTTFSLQVLIIVTLQCNFFADVVSAWTRGNKTDSPILYVCTTMCNPVCHNNNLWSKYCFTFRNMLYLADWNWSQWSTDAIFRGIFDHRWGGFTKGNIYLRKWSLFPKSWFFVQGK